MKVLFVINSLKEKSGIERVACLLANSFDLDLGFEIKIANRDTEKKDTSYNLNASIDVVNVGGGYHKFFKGINVLVKDFKPDYIFIHNMGRLSLLCSLLSKVDVKKIISLEHVAFQVRPNWVKFLTKILYKRIDQVVTLTQSDMKPYKEFHNNVVQINNISPFDSENSDIDYSIESRTIVSIGRLTFQKNFESLLEAWKIVSVQAPNWSLTIYGIGENQKLLENIIIEDKIDNVYLKGQTSDVESVYESAAFYVMSSRFEGLPMVLIEAQSHALPIISYDCPHGPSEVILNDENGYLVQNQNPKSLAEAMLKLISSDNLRLKFSKNAYQNAKRYSKVEILKEWSKVFN